MNPRALLAAVLSGGALTALAHGALDGPRWLLLVGLNLTVLVLVAVDLVSRVAPAGTALDLRSGGPSAFAPAVVHAVRVVSKDAGLPALDPRSPDTVFAFDITVMPGTRPPYRVTVRHPLDLQDARNRRSMVVRYDPEQPCRVSVPVRVPEELSRRAENLEQRATPAERIEPRRPERRVLGLGALIAAVLLTVIRLTG
ncbi:hypothetical protein OHA98_12100 [Streptomyces sp. NBC_00654]|uniref:hypothetical protein n=1 Tax=Streptomyces sp. NBC_00654 TaxID=2975799 RepID=UPI00224D5C91|nr:hypothetical protein [Streptomyces sp. NBC_00654]MCX4965566.1 hypothetical protein [Streptomyces sp. NBC_00654]